MMHNLKIRKTFSYCTDPLTVAAILALIERTPEQSNEDIAEDVIRTLLANMPDNMSEKRKAQIIASYTGRLYNAINQNGVSVILNDVSSSPAAGGDISA
jgi:hypothetical protein